MQTCLCNMQSFLKVVKMIIFRCNKCDIFLIFAQNRFLVHVRTSAHNLLFAKIRKKRKPFLFYYIKVGCKGV